MFIWRYLTAPPRPPRYNSNVPGIFLVCISDTHALHHQLPPLPDGDVLIHAGDFTNIGSREDVESFVEWIKGQFIHHKIFIAGLLPDHCLLIIPY
jgi:3',5'-cyclic AMP phosphodiesterase CpdA